MVDTGLDADCLRPSRRHADAIARMALEPGLAGYLTQLNTYLQLLENRLFSVACTCSVSPRPRTAAGLPVGLL